MAQNEQQRRRGAPREGRTGDEQAREVQDDDREHGEEGQVAESKTRRQPRQEQENERDGGIEW